MTQVPSVLVFMVSLALWSSASESIAQPPRLVKDINQRLTPTPSSPRPNADAGRREPSQFFTVLDRTYFVAEDARRGTELFETKGTTATTKMVEDIWWGERGSDPRELMSDGWRLFFSADDGKNGREMWVAEPLHRRVRMIELNTAPAEPSNPEHFFHLNGIVLFQAEAYQGNRELFVSDGSAANTRLLKDMTPTFGVASRPQNFASYRRRAYFHAFDGREVNLWRTDGTEAGTDRVSDVIVDFDFGSMVEFRGELYFVGSRPATGLELYKTDGTPRGSVLVHDVVPGRTGAEISNLVVYDDVLYFTALGIHPATRQATGLELWATDGKTLRLFDLRRGENGSDPHSFVIHGSEWGDGLFFVAAGDHPTSGAPVGEELWRIGRNGLELFDLVPGALPSSPRGMTTGPLGYLYFSCETALHGREVWRSNGQRWGTRMFAAISRYGPATGSEPRYFTPDRNAGLLFACDDGPHGTELWKTDGTVSGTKMLADINPQTASTQSARPVLRAVVSDTVYFTAEDGSSAGAEMWMTDGTAAGTGRVPGLADVHESHETLAVGGRVFVTGRGQDGKGRPTGDELWVVDHKSSSTTLLDINEGEESSEPRGLIEYRGGVLFAATGTLNTLGENTGRELWWSDGTVAGTRLVKDISSKRIGPNAPSSDPAGFFVYEGLVYFSAHEPTYGIELWVTDGTTSGTRLVLDINPGSTDSKPNSFATANGKLLFVATNIAYGSELWASDGTATGTRVIDMRAGAGSGFPRRYLRPEGVLTQTAGFVYFSADGDLNQNIHSLGQELWRSDGTAKGTRLVADVWPGASSSDPDAIVQIGSSDHVMFLSLVGSGLSSSGPALWTSDGTKSGTRMVRQLSTTWLGRGVTDTAAFGSRHCVLRIPFYASMIGQRRFEVYVSDGTPAGTKLIVDDSYPLSQKEQEATVMVAPGGRLFITRVEPNLGSELFVYEGLASSMRVGRGCSYGVAPPTLTCDDPLRGGFVRPAVRTLPFAIGLLMIGAWSPDPLALYGDCFVRVSLSGPSVFIPVASDGVGRWANVLSTGGSLGGYRYAMQAALSESVRPGSLALTNGVVLNIGR